MTQKEFLSIQFLTSFERDTHTHRVANLWQEIHVGGGGWHVLIIPKVRNWCLQPWACCCLLLLKLHCLNPSWVPALNLVVGATTQVHKHDLGITWVITWSSTITHNLPKTQTKQNLSLPPPLLLLLLQFSCHNARSVFCLTRIWRFALALSNCPCKWERWWCLCDFGQNASKLNGWNPTHFIWVSSPRKKSRACNTHHKSLIHASGGSHNRISFHPPTYLQAILI